jgi:FlaA1/EpsC-like NDP-sugar epimerase
VLNYELEPVEEQSARLAARRSNNVLSTDKFEQWMKMLSPDTRKLYYTPHNLPELKKSIENICIHRANAKANDSQKNTEKRHLLVTGGCGFIGSNFVNHWLRTYPQDFVINVDRLDTCSNIRNVEQADSPNYKLVVASINNKDLMLHLMKQYDITHVVHFAGKTSLFIAS